MKGNDTEYKWIRIDGLMKTNIPEPDLMFGFIGTKDYGTVLWLRLDSDAHRVGFALNPRLREKYPDGITEKEAVEEAVECLKLFELSIERLDWWIYYR
jgi:phenol 2-monooxygenase (NADPH)